MDDEVTRLRALGMRAEKLTGETVIDCAELLPVIDAAVRVTAERDDLRAELARLQGLVDARRTAEEAITEKARREADDLRAVLETRNAELTLAQEMLTAERQRAEAAEARCVRAEAEIARLREREVEALRACDAAHDVLRAFVALECRHTGTYEVCDTCGAPWSDDGAEHAEPCLVGRALRVLAGAP